MVVSKLDNLQISPQFFSFLKYTFVQKLKELQIRCSLLEVGDILCVLLITIVENMNYKLVRVLTNQQGWLCRGQVKRTYCINHRNKRKTTSNMCLYGIL